MGVFISSIYVILLSAFSPCINLILKSLFINNVASSVTLLFWSFAISYRFLNLNACGVCVNNKLFLLRLNIWFWVLYFIVSFELIIGTTALLFFKFLAIFFNNLIEKLGLAASCIKTFFGLYLFRNFNALKEESDLSFPPLMILIAVSYTHLTLPTRS